MQQNYKSWHAGYSAIHGLFTWQIKKTMSRYTTEIVAKAALGIEGNSFKDGTMHEMGGLIFDPEPIKALKMMAFFMLPSVTNFFKIKYVTFL